MPISSLIDSTKGKLSTLPEIHTFFDGIAFWHDGKVPGWDRDNPKQNNIISLDSTIGFIYNQCTLPSLNVDLDPGGYPEDLGLILEVLGVMVSSI